MYGGNNSITQNSLPSFLTLLQGSPRVSLDAGSLNLNEIPTSSATAQTSHPGNHQHLKFDKMDENGNVSERNSSCVHILPDTPGADFSVDVADNLLTYHGLSNVNVASILLEDRDNLPVFVFPEVADPSPEHFVDASVWCSGVPTNRSSVDFGDMLNPVSRASPALSHSLENQPYVIETPPTTPNKEPPSAAMIMLPGSAVIPSRPRPRLGGVSMITDLINEEDLDDIDIEFDELILHHDGAPQCPDLRVISEPCQQELLNVFSDKGATEPKVASETNERDVLESNDDVFFEADFFTDSSQGAPDLQTSAKNDNPFLDGYFEPLISANTENPPTISTKTTQLEGPCSSVKLDPRLREAWLRCQGSKTLEPLLKEEIRLKIMKRRLENGEEELRSDDPPPTILYQLTKEDHAKRDVRRAQNRGAARRFREKKKKIEDDMKAQIREREAINRHLTAEKEKLLEELSRIRQELLRHRGCGDCRLLQAAARVLHALPDVTMPDVTTRCQQTADLENIHSLLF